MIKKKLIDRIRIPPDTPVRLKDFDPAWAQTAEMEEAGREAVKQRAAEILEANRSRAGRAHGFSAGRDGIRGLGPETEPTGQFRFRDGVAGLRGGRGPEHRSHPVAEAVRRTGGIQGFFRTPLPSVPPVGRRQSLRRSCRAGRRSCFSWRVTNSCPGRPVAFFVVVANLEERVGKIGRLARPTAYVATWSTSIWEVRQNWRPPGNSSAGGDSSSCWTSSPTT